MSSSASLGKLYLQALASRLLRFSDCLRGGLDVSREVLEQILLQLRKKRILISVLGRHNTGKSTFLNALLANEWVEVCKGWEILRWLGRVIHCTLPIYVLPLSKFHSIPTSIAELPFYKFAVPRVRLVPRPTPGSGNEPNAAWGSYV